MDSEVMKRERQYFITSQMQLVQRQTAHKGLTLSSDFQHKILKEFYQ
jgi:hypothetical protein